SPLTLPDRGDQVDDATRDLARFGVELEAKPGVREQRSEILEANTRARLVGRQTVDEVDAHERRVLLAARRRSRRALDVVAAAQAEPPNLGRRNVRVVATGEVPSRAQEAVALVAQVEQAFDVDELAGVVVAARFAGFTAAFALTVASTAA